MKYNHPFTLFHLGRLLRSVALTVALVSVMWSCDIFSDEKLSPVNPSDGIGFTSIVEPVTRNLITSVGDIKYDGSRISLFGRAVLSGGGTTEIFDNTALGYASATDSWSYSPLQYWLSGATYDFAAFYPYKSSENFTHNASDKTFTYTGTYVSQLSTADQEDLLIGHTTRNVATEGKGTVVLPMKHALAAVRFSVRNATDNEFTVIGQYLQGIKNQGSNMVYDGTTVTWNTLGYAAGYTATTPQFVCNSGVTTAQLTYENTSCTISRVYYYNNAAMGTPGSYSNTTLNSTGYVGSTMPYIYNSGGFTENTEVDDRNTVNYYYTYDTQALNGGVTVPVSAITSVSIYDAAGFSPNADNYSLDSDGYLLVLPQTITADSKLKFETAVATTASRSITVANTVYKYVYNANRNTARSGGGSLVTYRTNNTTTRTINNVPTVSTTDREVNLADLASVTRWEAGKKYDYTITVSTQNILITVTVVPWIDREIPLN